MNSEVVEQLGKKNSCSNGTFVVGPKANETIENIHRLFIQLRLLLSHTDDIHEVSSPAAIFEELTNICHYVLDRKWYSTEEVLVIFEKLLKNYLLLLDSEEFVDLIHRQYSLANNEFLHSFYHSLDPAIFKTRMTMFSRLLDLLSSSTRILAFLQSELLVTSRTNEDLQRIVDNTCRILLIRIFPLLSSTDMISLKLSVIKFKKYEKTFFNLLIIFIAKHFAENRPSENDSLIQEILRFLYMLSKEVSIIPILINIECPQACLRWLALPYLKVEEYKYIMLILKNIVRHDEGIIILHQHECIKILTEFTDKILYTKIDYIVHQSTFAELFFIYHMIFYSIADPHTIYGIEHWEIIGNSLLPTIKNALSANSWICGDFYLSELLIILMRLFTNDNVVNYVLQNNVTLEFFYDMLKRTLREVDKNAYRILYGDEILLSMIVVGNIFWSISFQEQYKKDLIANLQLINKCEFYIHSVVSSTLISRQIFPLNRALDGIKQNLHPSKPTEILTTHSLMISYSYLDVESFRTLHQILTKNSKFSLCADADHWKQIVQNINQADLVLFLISNHFLTNKSCRQEFLYTRDILTKPCIGIYLDGDYPTIHWLNERTDQLKSIRFGDEFLPMIRESLSIDENSSDIKQWNDGEVQQWFTDHHLIPELYEFYQFQNGNELFLYAQAILAYPWTKEYERIISRFEKKFDEQGKSLSPHEFLKFIRALERWKQ